MTAGDRNPITGDELEAVLGKHNNVKACVGLFQGATEENRRALAPLVLDWYRTVQAAWLDRPLRRPRVEMPSKTIPGFLIEAVQAAVIATATFAELKRLPDFGELDWRVSTDTVFEILADRKPAWIDEWAEATLERRPEYWEVVRRLVRLGLCRRSDSDATVLGMMVCLDGPHRTIREALLEEPELLEHEIWRLFEVQRGNSLNFTARDEFRYWLIRHQTDAEKPKGWLETFVEFAAEGRLPRGRLLEASLSAVEREFPDTQSRWFSRLHEALEPTIEERLMFLPRYLGCLGNSNASTRSFALDVLKQLDHVDRLPGDDLLIHLRPVLLDRTKTRAKRALKLVERAADRSPALAAEAVNLCVETLAHEAADVQEAAWKLIERLVSEPSESLLAALDAVRPGVVPSLQDGIAKWTAAQRGLEAVGATEPALPETDSTRDPWDELCRAAGSLPEHLRRILRIPELLDAVADQRLDFPIIDLETWEFPRLLSPVVPIASLDELIDATAAALEGIESADEVERILDGVSRLCGERPAEFERRTGPLRKRALQRLAGISHPQFTGGGILEDVYSVVWAWLTGEFCTTRPERGHLVCEAGGRSWAVFRPDPCEPLLEAFSRRARAVAERAARREAQVLLSTPTHVGGWIDPVILLERWFALASSGFVPDPFEQALALLRLAPERRNEALRKLDRLGGEFAEALRYACGATVAIGPTASLWAAAARAQFPWADDSQVESRHPQLGPDTGCAGLIDIHYKPAHEHPGKIVIHHRPSGPKFDLGDFPARLLHEGFSRLWLAADGPLIVRWGMTVWPANSDPLLVSGVRSLLKNLDWKARLWANRTYLERLLNPDVPLTSPAVLLLALGLAAKEPGECGLAVDAAIAAIQDGRLNADRLGPVLHALFSTGHIRAARWRTSLETVSQASAWHAETVRTSVAVLFSSPTPIEARDLGKLLELFHELTVACRMPVPAATQAWLMSVNGSGKTARLAKKLLAIDQSPAGNRVTPLSTLVLGERLRRIERWQDAT